MIALCNECGETIGSSAENELDSEFENFYEQAQT
jgi:hypothetical protein